VRLGASSFVRLINDHRASPGSKRDEWRIVISALRYAQTHGAIHEDVAKLLADTLDGVLDGRVPPEWKPGRGRPRRDQPGPAARAAAVRYAAAATLGLLQDEAHGRTVCDAFGITERQYDRWLAGAGGLEETLQLFGVVIETYLEACKALPMIERPSVPDWLSPERVRAEMVGAAARYRARRRSERAAK
jgi:hypothetical protein